MEKVPFEQIASAFHPLIVSMIHKHHIYKDFDEYYQLALIGLWRAYQKLDDSKGSFSAYAYTTVRGTILSHLNATAQREERETPTEDFVLSSNEDQSLPVLLEQSIIAEQIESLTSREKIYVQEYLLKGYSYKELAAKYGVSVGAVKNWGKTARKKLKELLQHDID
ncbi:sigma-70 family RNA polymerase sigma factor [Priestia megaterium]|nr:sigma-70 family RNA polymerase sigma factor [Priestia megaterium]